MKYFNGYVCNSCGEQFQEQGCCPECGARHIGRSMANTSRTTRHCQVDGCLKAGNIRYRGTEGDEWLCVTHHAARYKAFSESIFRRDNWRCTRCGSSPPLELHHSPSRAHGGRNIPEHATSLCVKCHKEEH